MISIIIPCYNNEVTITETLNSVKEQSYKNYEIIIINDGSTDLSEKTINSFINNNTEISISYKFQENNGPSKARNYGASFAKGDYLVFLDADDIIKPTYLDKCITEFKKNNSTLITYTKAELFGKTLEDWDLDKYELKEFLFRNSIYVTAMIKRADFESVEGFDESLNYMEDWDLWINLISKIGGDIICVPEKLFMYRKHENKSSLTDLKNAQNKEDEAD